MATQWRYRRDGVELGPVAFHDLVHLVRGESLSPDDLVREDWNEEWRPAALAIGLFHMAGRQDLVDRWEAEQETLRLAAEAAAARARGEPSDELTAEDEPAWQRRLREVAAEQAAGRAASVTRTEIDETLAAALREVEDRERETRASLWTLWLRRCTGPAALHRVFRWGLTLLVAHAAAGAILVWSQQQAQRYPDRRRLAEGVRPFPLWGDCDADLFYFLLLDAMALAGLAAYGFARVLERLADD